MDAILYGIFGNPYIYQMVAIMLPLQIYVSPKRKTPWAKLTVNL